MIDYNFIDFNFIFAPSKSHIDQLYFFRSKNICKIHNSLKCANIFKKQFSLEYLDKF